MNNSSENHQRPDEATVSALREIASRHGTPTYAFDIAAIDRPSGKAAQPSPVRDRDSLLLEGDASLGICDVLADCGIGADVASAGELATALAAGFPSNRIFVAGPFKLPETIAQLHDTPEAIVSIDSLSELQWLSDERIPNSAVLRLRPDFGSCAVVPAGSESRFGFTCDALQRCRNFLPSCNVDVIGLHVFAGSQVLDADKLNEHLRRSLDLSLRAAENWPSSPLLSTSAEVWHSLRARSRRA